VTSATLLCVDVLQACPLCKDAIPNSDAQSAASLPGGFNYSIYYMLGSLFCVLGGFGFFVFRTIRNTDRIARTGGDPEERR
jgi:hypothetical protein